MVRSINPGLFTGWTPGARLHELLLVGRSQPRQHHRRHRKASPQRTRTLRLQRSQEKGIHCFISSWAGQSAQWLAGILHYPEVSRRRTADGISSCKSTIFFKHQPIKIIYQLSIKSVWALGELGILWFLFILSLQCGSSIGKPSFKGPSLVHLFWCGFETCPCLGVRENPSYAFWQPLGCKCAVQESWQWPWW